MKRPLKADARILIGLVFFLVGAAGAADKAPSLPEKSIAWANLGYETTSDGLRDAGLEMGYQVHRRDLFWPYPEEKQRAWDLGIHAVVHSGANPQSTYHGYKFTGELARKFSNRFLLNAVAGTHLIRTPDPTTSQIATHSIFAGDVSGYFHFNDLFDMRAGVAHDLVYTELVQISNVSNALAATTYGIDLTYHPYERWRLVSRNTYRVYSDTNERKDTDTSILYGISTGVPWIWVGAGVEYLSFLKPESTYWTPDRFSAYGPRFEGDFPIEGNFSVAGGLNINRNQQDGLEGGWGYYASAKLRYGTREGSRIELGFQSILSQQRTGRWTGQGYTLGYCGSF